MTRVRQAARLHLIHPLVSLGMPWLVAASSFAINLAVWGLTPASDDPQGFTGGLAALYVTVLIVYVQSVTQLLPFAMGLSLSRRAFYLGTALVAVAQSFLFYGIAISALVSIENATDGWGVGLNFWAPGIFDVGNPLLQVVVSGAPMLACAFVGVGIGVVQQRWGQAGTWGLILGTTVGFGALAVLITWLDAWRSVGEWFVEQPAEVLTIALPAAIALVAALASLPGIRRVVP